MTATFDSRIVRSGSVRDESLENGFAGREAAAYDAAYRSFGARLQATALRILRDRQAAQECVHDVFLHLWRQGSAYSRQRGSLEAFLVTCVRNRALMQIRSGRRQTAAYGRAEAPTDYTMEEDPIERDRIRGALARLNDGQADVISRAYFRHMTLNEVATDLQIPIGTVKTRLSAALRALRRELIPEASDAS